MVHCFSSGIYVGSSEAVKEEGKRWMSDWLDVSRLTKTERCCGRCWWMRDMVVNLDNDGGDALTTIDRKRAGSSRMCDVRWRLSFEGDRETRDLRVSW